MIAVQLHGAEFFARHGFYPEEQIIGGRFVVDITAAFSPAANLMEDDLQHTLNYEGLYAIAIRQMQQTRKLLETAAQAMVDDIRREYPYVENITVSLKKLNPPLNGPVAHSGVVITYDRKKDGI